MDIYQNARTHTAAHPMDTRTGELPRCKRICGGPKNANSPPRATADLGLKIFEYKGFSISRKSLELTHVKTKNGHELCRQQGLGSSLNRPRVRRANVRTSACNST